MIYWNLNGLLRTLVRSDSRTVEQCSGRCDKRTAGKYGTTHISQINKGKERDIGNGGASRIQSNTASGRQAMPSKSQSGI
jgi:hypothetical protein